MTRNIGGWQLVAIGLEEELPTHETRCAHQGPAALNALRRGESVTARLYRPIWRGCAILSDDECVEPVVVQRDIFRAFSPLDDDIAAAELAVDHLNVSHHKISWSEAVALSLSAFFVQPRSPRRSRVFGLDDFRSVSGYRFYCG